MADITKKAERRGSATPILRGKKAVSSVQPMMEDPKVTLRASRSLDQPYGESGSIRVENVSEVDTHRSHLTYTVLWSKLKSLRKEFVRSELDTPTRTVVNEIGRTPGDLGKSRSTGQVF